MNSPTSILDPDLPPRGPEQLLVSYFADASKRLRATILNPPGRKESSREWLAAWAAQRIAQVDQILTDLRAKSRTWTGKAASAQFAAGIAKANQQARDVGVDVAGSPARGTFTLISKETVAVFARDTYADLNAAIDSTQQRNTRLLRKLGQQGLSEADVNKVLAGGIIDGTPRETIRQLRDDLRAVHGDTVTVQGKNGPIEFDAGHYARLVATTRMREATVIARHERLQDLGLDLVVIIGRLSNNFCSAFLGQIFSLSGHHPKYPSIAQLPGGGGVAVPPFHPRCSKSTRPFVERYATPAQLRTGDGAPDAAQLFGQSASQAQRKYQDLQLRQQTEARYTPSAEVARARAQAEKAKAERSDVRDQRSDNQRRSR